VSFLKQSPRQERDFITLNPTYDANGKALEWGSDCCGLQDIGIVGNSQTGMWSLLRIGGVNAMCKFRDLFFYNGGHAISFDPNVSYKWLYHPSDILIMTMRGRGLNGLGTDNSFSRFDIAATQGTCVFASGANCRLDDFKIMGCMGGYNGELDGIICGGARLQMRQFDSQESRGHGLRITNAYDCTIELAADNNGMTASQVPVAVPTANGVFIESGDTNDIRILWSNRNGAKKFGHSAAYICAPAIKQTVTILSERNPFGTSTNLSSTSKIVRI
jgi:hypothetical protein